MGLRDIITGRHQVKGPAPDHLFAIATAYVDLAAEHNITSTGHAAIVFQALQNADFEALLKEVEEIVTATGGERQMNISAETDSFGYRWLILDCGADPNGVEDLAVGINAVSGSIETGGYGERILCAVFSFRDGSAQPVYFIYSYKRGTWYPFVPTGQEKRATERELQIKARVGNELPIEPELERWFPLWGIPL
ncbi:MAG TPA: hypothetical protein VMA83_04695 [Solirubrobacteraceae bacterium]|nr:hypothetical protein [Solirubrobacteraceae bacterium]